MAESIGTVARNKQADSVGGALDLATLKIYTGSKPASPDDAATGTLLVTFTFAADAFAVAAAGVAAMNGTLVQNAVATGTAGYFRIASADTTLVYDGTITLVGGGGDMELNSLSIVSGASQTISVGSITQPAT